MNRREFISLMVRSGLLVAGSAGFEFLPTRAEAAGAGISADALSCATNPIKPFLKNHPWVLPASVPAKQSFDLVSWDSPPVRCESVGALSIEGQSAATEIHYIVTRTTAADSLTARIQAAADAWNSPRSWSITQKVTQPHLDLYLSTTLEGTLANGTAVSNRGAPQQLEHPLTSMAALASSPAVLQHAAQSRSPFYVLTESGQILGPLQAQAVGVLPGTAEPMQVAAIWGARLLPTHIIYDSHGGVAQTGFLMSAVRSTIA